MFGKGLLQGLGITFKRMVGPNITEFYPEEMPNLPTTVRSSMGLERSKCISCNLCIMACPNSVIKLTSEKDENNKKVLKSYTMDVGRCLFCGMCSEVCPTKALTVSQEFQNSVFEPDELQWDMIKRAERKGKVG